PKLLAAAACEAVVPRATVVLRESPGGFHGARALQAVEGLVECRVLDSDHAVGAIVNPSRDGVTVHLAPCQRTQDEHVERSLQQVERLPGHASLPSPGMWRDSHTDVPSSRLPRPARPALRPA